MRARSESRQVPPPWMELALDSVEDALAEAAERLAATLARSLSKAIADSVKAATEAVAARGDDSRGGRPRTASKSFADVISWVGGYLAPMIVRADTAAFRWCPQWWEHAEVLARMEVMWETWEAARARFPADPSAMSIWWIEVFDPHMADITHVHGPFGQCDRTKGHRGVMPPLPHIDPQPRFFCSSASGQDAQWPEGEDD